MDVSAGYIKEKLCFCVGDQVYHDKVIEDKSFHVSAEVDDVRKSIVIRVTYQILPFDFATRTMIHGYINSYVLFCLSDDYKTYEEGYRLDLYLPDFTGRFYSKREIADKSDFYNKYNSNRYYAWLRQRK